MGCQARSPGLPYGLTTWDFKRRVRMEASDHYWDRAHVRSRTVEVVNADDPMWAFLRYDQGDIDWVADASGESKCGMMCAVSTSVLRTLASGR